jgi:hypothetical protein
MVADYDERHPQNVPSFFYHLGDVVYSFGENQYYYDQFYEFGTTLRRSPRFRAITTAWSRR